MALRFENVNYAHFKYEFSDFSEKNFEKTSYVVKLFKKDLTPFNYVSVIEISLKIV